MNNVTMVFLISFYYCSKDYMKLVKDPQKQNLRNQEVHNNSRGLVAKLWNFYVNFFRQIYMWSMSFFWKIDRYRLMVNATICWQKQ